MSELAIGPEGAWREHDSAPRFSRAEIGVLLFLATEVLFFAGLVAAALVLRAADPAWGSGAARVAWMPGLLGTALLLAGSLALGRALRPAAQRGLRAALLSAAVLGLAFLGLMAWEWRALFALGFDWRSGTFGSCFFVLTGLHGLHVLGGVAWTAVLALRTPAQASAARLASWYWHLVDGVWLVLFALFYWGGA